MTWGNYLFSFSGRINRAKLWLFVLILIGVELVYFTLAFALVGTSGLMMLATIGHPGAALAGGATVILTLVLTLALCVVVIWAGLALATKRLHDRNKSAMWLLIFYGIPLALNVVGTMLSTSMSGGSATPSPVGLVFSLAALAVSIWAFVELYCLRGTVGDNPYGPDPLAGKA